MLLGIGSRRDPRSCQDQFFSVELPAEIASCLAPKIQPHSPPTDAKKSRNVGQFGRGSGEIFGYFGRVSSLTGGIRTSKNPNYRSVLAQTPLGQLPSPGPWAQIGGVLTMLFVVRSHSRPPRASGGREALERRKRACVPAVIVAAHRTV